MNRGLQELDRQLKENGTPSVVWSRESLSSYILVKNARCVQLIRDSLPASKYRVVIYLRRQDHYLRSAYLQWGIKSKHLKNRLYAGRVLGFDEWLEGTVGKNFEYLRDETLDYHALVQAWSDVFGSENVVVRVFEKEQLHQRNLLRDFCHAAKLPQANCHFNIPNENVSFCMELYDMLGMYHSVFDEPYFPEKMCIFLETVGRDPFFAQHFFSTFSIPAKRRIEILQHCEESNRKVAREFLGREDGVLFREPWPSPEAPYQPYGGLTTEKLVPILLHLLQKQDQRIGELESQARLTIGGLAKRIVRKVKQKANGLHQRLSRGKAAVHGDGPDFPGDAGENATVPFSREGDRSVFAAVVRSEQCAVPPKHRPVPEELKQGRS